MNNSTDSSTHRRAGAGLKLLVGALGAVWLGTAACGYAGLALLTRGQPAGVMARAPSPTPPPTYAATAAAAAPRTPTAVPTPGVEPTRTPAPPPPSATPPPTRPAATPSPTNTPEPPADAQRQLRVFQRLWSIVNTRYIYPDFNGVDWRKARTDTESAIRAGMGDARFHETLSDLIDSLGDEHSSFLTPEQVTAEDSEFAGQEEYVGVGIRWELNPDKGYTYVLQTFPNSPAEQAGVRAHDHILAVNGVPTVKDGAADMSGVRGPAGTPVTLTLRAPGGVPRAVAIVRGTVQSAPRVESRLIPNTGTKRIGYVLVPTFFEDDIGNRVRDALRGLMKDGNLDGLILDMRINGGGAYSILSTNLGFFTSGRVGQLVNRNDRPQALTVVAERVGNSQTVPLVVLVGRSTASYAEVFSGALQARKRAVLIGAPTAGNIETLRRYDFEDGSAVWIAEQTFELPDRSGWEGKGLTPNVAVTAEWDEFTADSDPGVRAALDHFNARK